jgi:hypothetical protein
VPDEDYEMKTVYSYNEDKLSIYEEYFWSLDLVTWDSLAKREIIYDEN